MPPSAYMSSTRTAQMIRRTTRSAAVIIFGLVLTACGPTSEGDAPRLQIVLSDNGGVYVADWLARNLRPKLLTDFGGTVRVQAGSPSVGGDMIGVVGSPSDTRKDTVYLIDPSTGKYQKVFDELPIHTIAIAPNQKSIALLSTDVLEYDLTKRRARPVVRDRGFLTVSWRPDGEELTYDTRDLWIESVNLRTQRIERLVRGITPAWSPDGTKLAYRQHRYGETQEDVVFLYDPARGTSREVHRRSGWQREVYAFLYWSPDGRYLSFNVEWNLVGLRSDRCVVLEVASGKTFTVRGGDLYCGPWLAKR